MSTPGGRRLIVAMALLGAAWARPAWGAEAPAPAWGTKAPAPDLERASPAIDAFSLPRLTSLGSVQGPDRELATSQEPCAAGPRWSAMAVWTSQVRQGHERFNPGNGARMPYSAHQGAALIDGQGASWSARARWQMDRRDFGSANGQVAAWSDRFDITQIKWTLPLVDAWALVLGRINLALDDGQSFHPLDFFEDMIRGGDLEDRTGRSRGFPMVMVERATPGSGWRLAYSDDRHAEVRPVYGDPNPNFNRGLRQVLLSWRRSEGAWTWTTLWQRPWPGRAGLGGSFSWVPASAWAFHGAAFAAPGNPLPVHPYVVTVPGRPPDGRDVHLGVSPVAPWLAADDVWRWRALVGAQYTREDAGTWLVELWRDQRGMSPAQWGSWRRLLDFHDRLPHALARQINLAYDLQALRVPSGPHVFTQYRHGLGRAGELRASVLWAQDGSGTGSLRWRGPAQSWGDLSVEGWRRFGSAASRYGALPDGHGAELTLRLLF